MPLYRLELGNMAGGSVELGSVDVGSNREAAEAAMRLLQLQGKKMRELVPHDALGRRWTVVYASGQIGRLDVFSPLSKGRRARGGRYIRTTKNPRSKKRRNASPPKRPKKPKPDPRQLGLRLPARPGQIDRRELLETADGRQLMLEIRKNAGRPKRPNPSESAKSRRSSMGAYERYHAGDPKGALKDQVWAALWKDPKFVRLETRKDAALAVWNRADAFAYTPSGSPDLAIKKLAAARRAMRAVNKYADDALKKAGAWP